MHDDMKFVDYPEMFPELPALAARLGVPKLGPKASGLTLGMKNGDKYSVFALANAFLDRIDAALQKDASSAR